MVGADNVAPESAVSVLLVDDEAALLDATARLLRAAGMIVTPCANGEAAIAHLKSDHFGVVVSDLEMPGLGGIALLRLLREQQIDVPVVLVTGSPTLDSAMKAVEYGAFKYLTKPVDRAELRLDDRARGARGRRAQWATHAERIDREAPPDRSSVEAGAVIADRYRLRRELGAGGMGEVWEATHLLTGRPVALKVLHPSLNARAEMRRRLLREARAATAFAHPNVIEVFDVFELADGTPVIVMELLRGETLRARLDQVSSRPEIGMGTNSSYGVRGPAGPDRESRERPAAVSVLSTEECCAVMLPVVSAVGAAHANGVIHRDIKPANVMLCAPNETVKVMDFGVAKLLHADPRDATSGTAAGVAVGTLGYMAPEQACGESDIDHRADIWSIGALLYEALAGVRPLPGATLGQIIAHQLTETPKPLAERVPEVPRTLAALVDRMLEREPADRPADLREVHLELGRHTHVVAPSFGAPALAAARDPDPDGVLRSALGHAPTQLGVPPQRRRGT